MRPFILVGFLSLWIFCIITPSVLTIVSKGEETIMVLSHKEEEQQETGKKDTVEEKIIPQANQHALESDLAEEAVHGHKYSRHSSSHILEIPLPPPEHSI